jgi:YD repeat-containing protein
MLKRVVNPQQGKIRFGYDALGRRTCKEAKNRRTNWLWDVPIRRYPFTVNNFE